MRGAAPACSEEMVGTWRGSGVIVLTNGQGERIRCRAAFAPTRERAFP